MDSSLESGLQISIELMKSNLDMQYESVDSFKATGRSILSAASITTGLLAALLLAYPKPSASYALVFQIGVLMALALYLLEMILCIRLLMPSTMHAPVAPSRKILDEYFVHEIGLDKQQVNQLNAILNAVEKNQPTVLAARRTSMWAQALLTATVSVLLLLCLMPR